MTTSDLTDNLTLISFGQEKFLTLWDQFVKENSCSTWRYLSSWMNFQRYYSGESLLKDISFLVLDQDGQVVAICPLFLEKVQAHTQFSFAFGYLPAPLIKNLLLDKQKQKIKAFCYNKINILAQQYGASKCLLMIDHQGEQSQKNDLLEYGYLNTGVASMFVDLTVPRDVVWSRIRKSYQSLINKALRAYKITIYDHQNPNFQVHEQYREMHHKAAGRVTRSPETFNLQYEMLKDDNAVLIGAEHDGRWVAFDYFFHQNGKAFYGSAADEPSTKLETPVGHALIWSAINYYMIRNFKNLDMGLQQFGNQWFDCPSAKEISISFFKRGFGGNINSLDRGIKYYDPVLLEHDLRDFTETFIKTVVRVRPI